MSSASTSDVIGSKDEEPSTSTQDEEKTVDAQTQFELLHVIERFLEGGQFGGAAAALRREINEKRLVPSRIDYNGTSHERNYRQFLSSLTNLPSTSQFNPDTLPTMMSRLSSLSDRSVAPPVKGLKLRLITNKRSALQRTNDVLLPPRRPNLIHGNRGQLSILKTKHSPIELLRAREMGSRVPVSRLPSERSYELIQSHFRILGHLANVFCVAFDRTENYIITGADDNLVKVWNADRAMLKFTYRGHSGEIADLAVSHCNQLVASGSMDKTIRVWRLQNGETLQILRRHTSFVTSVRFLPYTGNGSMRYLVTAGNDCIVNFHVYNQETLTFPSFPGNIEDGLVYHRCERDQPGAKMLSICHSRGGNIVLIGETHGVIRLYRMHEDGVVEKMNDLVAHTDRVDSLMWAHNGLKFCSGSKDGLVKIWRFQYGEWNQTVLSLSPEELIRICGLSVTQNPNSKNKYKVSMVCWTLDDSRIVTTGSDHSFRVWDANAGCELMKLSLHTDDAFHLCAHPIHPHLVLSAGHDGIAAMWDVVRGVVVHKWTNTVERGEQAAIYDIVLNSDATRFALTDNKGHVSLFGLGTHRWKNYNSSTMPRQQFFSTDYSPVVLDDRGFAIDEQTGWAPHLLPPPRLINMDMHEYDASIQAMVPGRDMGVELDDTEPACVWVTRDIVPRLHQNELKVWTERMCILGARDNEEFTREMTRMRPPSTPAPDIIVPTKGNVRVSRPTNFRAAFIAENAIAQARSRENQRNRIHQARQMLIARRDVSLRYLGVMPDEANDGDMAPIDMRVGNEVEEEELEEEETDTSDTDYESDGERRERRDRERQERESEQMAWRSSGTTSRPRRRERGEYRVEEEEEVDESSQHSRSARRRTRRVEEDEFGNDLSIDMIDEPSTSTGRRGRRREETREVSERPERTKPRNRRVRASAERQEEEDEMEVKEEEMEDTVVRRDRRPTGVKADAWKYSFPDWMREVKRKRFPYVAQIGDHVVYFRQGHEGYLTAVEKTKTYKVEHKMYPNASDIEYEEFAVVEDVKYTLRPYRLTQLKLARTDSEGRRSGFTWTVKYHDMENVPDFIILRSFYEEGLAMGLDVGDEIEAPIDGMWYKGTVENMNMNQTYQNARWQSVEVRWATGEEEAICLWDFRKSTNATAPNSQVSEEEVTTMGSVPYCEGDWPDGDDGETTSRRLKRALNLLAELPNAIEFKKAVPIDDYPDYPATVAYATDIETICERIDNHYYRRLRSLLQDVRHLALAAEAYNQKGTPIVINAKVLVEAIVRLANDPTVEDVIAFYDSCFDLPENELLEYKRKPRPELNPDAMDLIRVNESAGGNEEREGAAPIPGWIRDAVEILEDLMQQTCARHFVINNRDDEELVTVWETCDDLTTLCDRVRGCEMSTPKEIETAVHSLVSTAKNTIENRRSTIYKDVVTLHSQFNLRFKTILAKFESMKASVSQTLGVPIEHRSLRRRNRDVPLHAYNTRRSDQVALNAVALNAAAAAEYDDQPTSSSRSAARHATGFYRSMVNGGGRRDASEETEVSSTSSRRRSTRNVSNTLRRMEEEERESSVPLRSRGTRSRRVIEDTEEEEEDDEPANEVIPASEYEGDDTLTVKEEEEDEDGESEYEDTEDEDFSLAPSKKSRRGNKRKAESTEDDESVAASTSTASSSRRSARQSKRRRMSSGDDEEERKPTRGRRNEQSSGRPTRAAARHSQQTYDERSEEDDEEESRVMTSVSQRGRQRRMRTFS